MVDHSIKLIINIKKHIMSITSIKKNKKVVTKKVEAVKPFKYYDEDLETGFNTAEQAAAGIILKNMQNEEVVMLINNKFLQFEACPMPACCGITELGSLAAQEGINTKDAANFIDALVIKGHTIIVNTNGVGGSLRWDSILTKCKYFEIVKRFKNSNSKNMINVWMSNND